MYIYMYHQGVEDTHPIGVVGFLIRRVLGIL